MVFIANIYILEIILDWTHILILYAKFFVAVTVVESRKTKQQKGFGTLCEQKCFQLHILV